MNEIASRNLVNYVDINRLSWYSISKYKTGRNTDTISKRLCCFIKIMWLCDRSILCMLTTGNSFDCLLGFVAAKFNVRKKIRPANLDGVTHVRNLSSINSCASFCLLMGDECFTFVYCTVFRYVFLCLLQCDLPREEDLTAHQEHTTVLRQIPVIQI